VQSSVVVVDYMALSAVTVCTDEIVNNSYQTSDVTRCIFTELHFWNDYRFRSQFRLFSFRFS